MNVTWQWVNYLEEVEKEKEHSKMTFEFLDIELGGPSQKKGMKKQDPIFSCFFATPQIEVLLETENNILFPWKIRQCG